MRWMISAFALLFAAGVVGILHMAAPDHWATLVILGRGHVWTHGRLFKNSMLASLGHVFLSVVLGFAVVGIGLLTSSLIVSYVTTAIGLIMLVGGTAYLVRSYLSRNAARRAEGHSFRDGFGNFAVMGGVLSPDLSILPIFLLAVPLGFSFAVYTAIVFAVASVATLITMVLVGHILVDHTRVSRRFGELNPRYNDMIVGAVIAVVGAYVLLFG